MCVHKPFIDSSIVNEAIRTISNQFIIFYEKISRVQKPKVNQNQQIFSLLEVFMRNKLLPLLVFVRLFVYLIGIGLVCIFVRAKSLSTKKLL